MHDYPRPACAECGSQRRALRHIGAAPITRHDPPRHRGIFLCEPCLREPSAAWRSRWRPTKAKAAA